MAKVDFSGGTWRKSSYSGGGNDCVEVALLAEHVGVRDSKNPGGGALNVSTQGWRALLGVVGRD
jgi:hypothetical protein